MTHAKVQSHLTQEITSRMRKFKKMAYIQTAKNKGQREIPTSIWREKDTLFKLLSNSVKEINIQI